MPSPFSSKFVKLLQRLTAAEWQELEKWLQSPWCNRNKNLPVLLAKLKPYHPDFSDDTFSKEKLFRQVLPKGKYSERRINNLLSEAYLTAEKFLVFQRFQRADGLQQLLLAQEFQGRGLDDWFFRKTEQEIARLEAKEAKDWDDHLHLFRLHRRIYHHPDSNLRRTAGHATLVQMSEQIDLLYLLEKAVLLNEMMTRNRLLQADQHEVEAGVEQWLVASEGTSHPSLLLYRMRFSQLEEIRLPQYETRKQAFLQHVDQLNQRERIIHLLSLLNDAKQLIKSGVLDITDILPLYQLGLKTGALLNQGKLSEITYTTIVSASNTQGSFAETNEFIAKWSDKLDEAVREDGLHWAKAHTAFWQKELQSSRKILQAYDFHTPTFQMLGRILRTQVYFELAMNNAADQLFLFQYLDTFEKWLSREKTWSRSSKQAFLRFVQTCRALARFDTDADPNPQKIESLLEKKANVQARNWLKQKQSEILQRKRKRLSTY